MADAFPDFALRDLDGAEWTRSRLLGRRSVVFCFASW
jgi:hypothetical protein